MTETTLLCIIAFCNGASLMAVIAGLFEIISWGRRNEKH